MRTMIFDQWKQQWKKTGHRSYAGIAIHQSPAAELFINIIVIIDANYRVRKRHKNGQILTEGLLCLVYGYLA